MTPTLISKVEVQKAQKLDIWPPLNFQWYEVDQETASCTKRNDLFLGGVVCQITFTGRPILRYFIEVLQP